MYLRVKEFNCAAREFEKVQKLGGLLAKDEATLGVQIYSTIGNPEKLLEFQRKLDALAQQELDRQRKKDQIAHHREERRRVTDLEDALIESAGRYRMHQILAFCMIVLCTSLLILISFANESLAIRLGVSTIIVLLAGIVLFQNVSTHLKERAVLEKAGRSDFLKEHPSFFLGVKRFASRLYTWFENS